MADIETDPQISEGTPNVDVDMGEGEGGAGQEETGLPEIEPEKEKRVTFLDFLKSPIVAIDIGTGEDQTTLHAHQDMLIKSPYFAEICANFSEGETDRRISLPHDNLTATGSVLEYLYNDEYFPRRLSPGHKSSEVETDPSIPLPDNNGESLLRHARVYTLADKFRLPALKSLAHSKISKTQSNAKGEIAYARFVYKETSAEDKTIRKPVAAFWATRSHVLRHQAEDEFRAMCLEFPQFGFDVLSLVLDKQEKTGAPRGEASVNVPVSGRKRARVSQG
ncbi:uncharacterized protein BDZ99DRAFT_466463 [Mytilinidion resinicola]|uniref:BTB domain-containing protein n=1 Tax=Mytilinidion resinicola TaxID=574789 RepID=A0A6A6YAB9_9PEZI|nr:uncharacterized protein BDZ99DRAFT_466463 [Mytilinidion resinicola]KAF2805473.1 hypothetical protein BDZ99DRAFT_466463 [Mytilinidion resinicola]